MEIRIEDLIMMKAIEESGSLKAAARRLCISPTRVTKQLAVLEERYGVMLVDRARGNSNTTITPVGRLFLQYATRILALSNSLEHELMMHANGSNVIRIGVMNGCERDLLRLIGTEQMEQILDKRIILSSGARTELEQMYQDGLLDTIITYESDTNLRGKRIHVLDVEVGIRLSDATELRPNRVGDASERLELRIEELLKEPIMLPPRNSRLTRKILESVPESMVREGMVFYANDENERLNLWYNGSMNSFVYLPAAISDKPLCYLQGVNLGYAWDLLYDPDIVPEEAIHMIIKHSKQY